MALEQLSVFVENKPGRVAKITEVLQKAVINIRAMSIAELGEFGVIRLIVDNPYEAKSVLVDSDLSASVYPVLAVEMDDEPGGLAKIAEILGKRKVNIEYAYTSLSKGKAILIARVSDIERAERELSGAGIRTLNSENTLVE